MEKQVYRKFEYPIDEVPLPGRSLEIAPGIHWVRMPLPFALDHINVWLLEDGDGWTLVDTGYGRKGMQELWKQVFTATLGGRPLKRVIATHYHPDHLGLAAWLVEDFGAELWMTEAEFLTAHSVFNRVAAWDTEGFGKLYRCHGLDEQRRQALLSRGVNYRHGVPALPRWFRRIMDGEHILIHDRHWQVIVGYGHAPEHTTLYCEELDMLISGDQILPGISTNITVWPIEPEGNPLALYLSSLESFRKLPAETLLLPSHGHVFRGLQKRVDGLKQHHETRLEKVWQVCIEPCSAADLLGVLFGYELDLHQLFFAMGESIAHLNYLMYGGSLRRFPDRDGVLRFSQAGPRG